MAGGVCEVGHMGNNRGYDKNRARPRPCPSTPCHPFACGKSGRHFCEPSLFGRSALFAQEFIDNAAYVHPFGIRSAKATQCLVWLKILVSACNLVIVAIQKRDNLTACTERLMCLGKAGMTALKSDHLKLAVQSTLVITALVEQAPHFLFGHALNRRCNIIHRDVRDRVARGTR